MKEKIGKALKSAATYLERAVKALTNKNEAAAKDSAWYAASELEYALFLFSVTHQSEMENLPKTSTLKLGRTQIGNVLAAAENALMDAKKSFEAGKFGKAYRKTWAARKCLLKAQEIFEKKAKEEKSKSSPTPPS